MESPAQHSGVKEFQVAGVSRSGRVRKKSSKLLDFESPEEFDKKTKRNVKPTPKYGSRGRPSNAVREMRTLDCPTTTNAISMGNAYSNDSTLLGKYVSRLVTAGDSDEEIENLVADLVQGVEAECSSINQSKVRQSLYMREKSNKRKMLVDGVVVTGKMHRKDKGKSRHTAYSLWAREIRKKDFPDLDFSNAARRLSELWSNVSHKEKNAWRRKAKIQATKTKTRENIGQNTTTVNLTTNVTDNVPMVQNIATGMNRATTNRQKKLAAERKQQIPDALKQKNTSRFKVYDQKGNLPSNKGNNVQSNSDISSVNYSSEELAFGRGGITQPSIDPIDAAAHLKLLGESLTIIGERLKEHDGQIALSGSLSVLLDSLLCSLGPLLCMTTQIPGLEGKVQLKMNLAETLDNIAYVMPV